MDTLSLKRNIPVEESTVEQEEIKALNEQLNGFKGLLQQLLDKGPRQLCKIKIGPMIVDGNAFYRVQNANGTMELAAFREEYVFVQGHKGKLEPGREVIVVAGVIIGIVPEPLVAKEVLPTFDLITWGDIGGLKSQIQTIKEATELPLANQKLSAELGLKPMKGLLLYGPPGCGKTLVAKAIASTVIGATKVDAEAFTYCKGGDLLSMYVGATEQRIAQMFKNARDYSAKTGKRAVLFIDEAEAILPTRGSRKSSDVETTIVPTFLAEMDGFDKNGPFVILSTNLPNSIDPAVLRDGRIDVKIPIERPVYDDVIDIFKIHFNTVKLEEPVEDLAKYATDKLFNNPDMVAMVSGSMIEAIVKSSIHKTLARKIADPTTPTGVISIDVEQVIDNYK